MSRIGDLLLNSVTAVPKFVSLWSRFPIGSVALRTRYGANLEARNSYGGTALGQAIWSAAHSNEQKQKDYIPVIETLIKAGALIDDDSRTWLSHNPHLAKLLT